MGAGRWEDGVTADTVGGDGPRRVDFLAGFGYALEGTSGLPCPICGGPHLETVHAPSTDALRAGADPAPPTPQSPTWVIPGYDPLPGEFDDAYHYKPPPEVLHHPDNALFSDDAERADDAARKARRARLVAEHNRGSLA